jgi:malonyl CoA-acyl carrier protein transacylase
VTNLTALELLKASEPDAGAATGAGAAGAVAAAANLKSQLNTLHIRPSPCSPQTIMPACHCKLMAAAGPKSQLDDTVYSQPALFVTNLAALELLKTSEPDTAAAARAMAGLSLGEYCALVAAGAMSFKDGLKVCYFSVILCYLVSHLIVGLLERV